jgi:hypothetical protein
MIAVWMITCYYVCKSDAGFQYFEYWILCGFPFGIRKMFLFLIPRNFGIAGGVGVLALNAIIGGLIGGFIIISIVIKSIFAIISAIFGSARAKVE